MKLGKSFYVIMAVLVVFIVLFERYSPVQFNWEHETFSHDSKQPFGCYVFDSIMSASLPGGYEVTNRWLDESSRKSGRPCNYLIVDNYLYNTQEEANGIKKALMRGDNVMIVSLDPGIDDTESKVFLGLNAISGNINRNLPNNDTSVVRPDIVVYQSPKNTYITRGGLINTQLKISSDYRVIAKYRSLHSIYDDESDSWHIQNEWRHFAVIRKYGKGRLLVCVAPHYFSNYGILNDDIRPLVMRLMNEIDGKRHWVRYDYTLNDSEEEATNDESLFRFLLSKPPLRWALYLSLVTLVLFVFFTARRRQRTIPVVKQPANLSMSMIKHIGTLYYLRHDNVDLLCKKWTYFAEQVRRTTGADVEDKDHQDEELQTLAQLSGMKLDELKQQIREVNRAMEFSKLSNDSLKRHIKTLNNILSNI